MKLPVTVLVVQPTLTDLTDLARSHVETDPADVLLFCFGMLLTEIFLFPSWDPEGRFCGK